MILKIQEPTFWGSVKEVVRPDSVFVSPTDTVYGFGAPATNAGGITRIRAMKGLRDSQFIILIKRFDQIPLFASLSDELSALVARYWPGSITFIVPGKMAGSTVALRMPKHPFLEEFLDISGPIVSTSCNVHGLPTVTDINEAFRQFGASVDLYVDGGPLVHNVPSTLVDLTGNAPRILRQGKRSFP